MRIDSLSSEAKFYQLLERTEEILEVSSPESNRLHIEVQRSKHKIFAVGHTLLSVTMTMGTC